MDDEDVAEATRSARVDVVVDLRIDPRSGTWPSGTADRWSLRYADGPDGVRRTSLERPTGGDGLALSVLWIESATGGAFEAGAGIGRSRRVGFGRDRDAVLWRASALPARRLAHLIAGERVPTPDLDLGAHARVTEAQRPGHRPRTGAPFGAFAAFIAGKLAGRALFRTGWVVLVRDRQPGDVAPKDLSGFRPIDAPTGRFYADPFVLAGPDGPTIYVEDCPDGTHRGRISSLRRDIDGRWGLERVVLADLEHRAYPHAIRTDESIVMTPDGGRHGGVDFFVDGPTTDGLARVGQALEGAPASDPTVLWHDDRFWLFVTLTEHGMSPWDELHLFSSASITGLWHPHPRNPIVADVRSARPAGRIFRLGDRLVRPGQDCSVAYGHRIALSEITTLTADRYEERPMGSIEPVGLPGFQRTHTYTFDGTVEALDGYRRMVRRPGRQRRPS